MEKVGRVYPLDHYYQFWNCFSEVHNMLPNDIRLFLSMEAQQESWSDGFLTAAFEQHDRTPRCGIFTADYCNLFLCG